MVQAEIKHTTCAFHSKHTGTQENMQALTTSRMTQKVQNGQKLSRDPALEWTQQYREMDPVPSCAYSANPSKRFLGLSS